MKNKNQWLIELRKLYKEIDAVCPEDCWDDFYNDGYTPKEAFAEEVSNWDD